MDLQGHIEKMGKVAMCESNRIMVNPINAESNVSKIVTWAVKN